MAAPAVKVEIAFDSNFTTPAVDRTWVDVSARVFGSVGISYGRTDPVGQTSPSTCSLSLDNRDGALTAGNVASTYYPNVKLDRPIRVTVTPDGGTPSVRFLGYVDGWPVEWPMGTDLGTVYANITATSRTGRLTGRAVLEASAIEDARASSAEYVWPLNDDAGSIGGHEFKTNGPRLTRSGVLPRLSFTGSGVRFRQKFVTGGSYGQYLTSTVPVDISVGELSLAVSFNTTDSYGGDRILPIWNYASALSMNHPLADANDGRDHRIVATRSSGGVWTIYLDDEDVTSAAPVLKSDVFTLCFTYQGGASFPKTALVWNAQYWLTELSPSDVSDDYVSFQSGLGEASDDRLLRYAGYVDIPTTEVDVTEAGTVVMGSTDTSGLAPADAFRVVESTEGGLLIDGRDGTLILQGRRRRNNSSPVITVSMADEEVAAGYSPVLDRGLLRNDVTGTNAATSADGSESTSYRVKDVASIAEYGTSGGSLEVNAAEPEEAFSAASWVVARYAEPQPRVPQLSIDLLPLDGSRADEFLAVFVGDRIEVEGRPAQDSTDEIALFVEGGSETYSADAASITWNCSPVTVEDSLFVIDTDSIDGPKLIAY